MQITLHNVITDETRVFESINEVTEKLFVSLGTIKGLVYGRSKLMRRQWRLVSKKLGEYDQRRMYQPHEVKLIESSKSVEEVAKLTGRTEQAIQKQRSLRKLTNVEGK